MSFDLAVWDEPGVLGDREAARKYLALVELEVSAPTNPGVVAFVRDLNARYPENDPNSPWSSGWSTTADSVVLTVKWSRSDEVAEVIIRAAERYNLLCFDPQTECVRTFPRRGSLVFWTADGARYADPTPSQLAAAINGLDERNWHAVLERTSGPELYIQTAVDGDGYVLEHREGSVERHFQTHVPNASAVVAAFTAFAAGDESWKGAHAWQRID